MSRALPDYLQPALDLVFVGINPGLKSAAAGHHYAGPGNHFCPLLFESRLVPERLSYLDDARTLEWNIGLTNIVHRATSSAAELSAKELRDGATALRRKLLKLQPRIACFNGKLIYQAFAHRPCGFGPQDERVGETALYVMPSTSARTAAYQRSDKLRYFLDLKRELDRMRAPAAS